MHSLGARMTVIQDAPCFAIDAHVAQRLLQCCRQTRHTQTRISIASTTTINSTAWAAQWQRTRNNNGPCALAAWSRKFTIAGSTMTVCACDIITEHARRRDDSNNQRWDDGVGRSNEPPQKRTSRGPTPCVSRISENVTLKLRMPSSDFAVSARMTYKDKTRRQPKRKSRQALRTKKWKRGADLWHNGVLNDAAFGANGALQKQSACRSANHQAEKLSAVHQRV